MSVFFVTLLQHIHTLVSHSYISMNWFQKLKLKGCVHYIFASLFYISKKEQL